MGAMHAQHLALLAEAIAEAAAAVAKQPVTLVSVTFDCLAPAREGEAVTTHVTITRATRTIVFSSAELRGDDARRILAATAVHRI